MTALAAGCGDNRSAPADSATSVDAAATDATTTDASASGLDDGFGDHGRVALATGCQGLVIDANDRPVVLIGNHTTLVGLARYTTAGELDTTFAHSGDLAIAAKGIETSLFMLPSGKLLVTAFNPDPAPGAWHAVRFQSDGTPDPGFGSNGDVSLPLTFEQSVFGVGQRSDGGLDLAAVGDLGAPFTFLRLTSVGAADASFGTNGVASPSIPSFPPGYYAHAAYLAEGEFLISGATFASVGMGTGPVTGHLFVVGNGAVVTSTMSEQTEYLTLFEHGSSVYLLHDNYPMTTNAIERVGVDLVVDPTFHVMVPVDFSLTYGLYNGGALAVAPAGELMVTNAGQMFGMDYLVRTAPDGTPKSRDKLADLISLHPVRFCGFAYDSTGRPLIATDNGATATAGQLIRVVR